MTGLVQLRSAADRERGSAAVEAVIGVPAFCLFIMMIFYAGRVAIATQSVQAAAAEGARSASISRNQSDAQANATAAAAATLTNENVACTAHTVTVDTAGFAAPVGTPTQIAATVTCTLNLADLALPGIPGVHTVTATMTSPLDTYRER